MRTLPIIFTILLLYSCVKEVTLTPKQIGSKVVVTSLFLPDTLLRVHVSLTAEMSDAPPIVTNATVRIYKNNQLLPNISNTNDGWYRTEHYPEEGATYRVEVEVPNFEMVWAESMVPIYPEFLEPPYAKKVGLQYVHTAQSQMMVYDTYLHFQDDPNVRNFYEIWGIQIIDGDIHPIPYTDPSILSDSDLDLYFNIKSLVFTDNLFNGTEKLLKLDKFGSHAPDYEPWSGLTLTFHALSEEYFLYRKSLHRHQHAQITASYVNGVTTLNDPLTLLFLGQPVELFSNVHGGLGIFAGFNARVYNMIYID